MPLLDAHEIDALFTDINMPVMSGPELLRELQRQGRQHAGSHRRVDGRIGSAQAGDGRSGAVVRQQAGETGGGARCPQRTCQQHLQTDRGALDRALTVVAEESFFAMVDPVPDDLPAVEGRDRESRRVTFEGSFCRRVDAARMPRALAHELTAAFIGEEVPSRRRSRWTTSLVSSPTWCAAAG